MNIKEKALTRLESTRNSLVDYKSMKGQGIGGSFIGIVVAAILLIIGVLVFAIVSTSIPTTGISSAANTTINNIISTSYSAFDLATVGLIVLAAVIILGLVFLLGRRA